jgi:hypothetical protein
MSPEQSISDKATRDFIESATKESGTSGRTYKSGLVWAVPDSLDALRDEARKVLAWEDIADEEDELRLDDAQKRQLAENVKKAQRDAKEIVWRTYATQSGLKIGLNVEIAPEGGVSIQKVDEIKVALRELGLPDDVSFD